MWCFSLRTKRSGELTAEADVQRYRHQYDKALDVFACEETVHIYLPANVDPGTAQLLTLKPALVAGLWLLEWYEPWMRASVEECCAELQKRRKAEAGAQAPEQPQWMTEVLSSLQKA